jgi:hypothetical protein
MLAAARKELTEGHEGREGHKEELFFQNTKKVLFMPFNSSCPSVNSFRASSNS